MSDAKLAVVYISGSWAIDAEGRIWRGEVHVATRDPASGEVSFVAGKGNYKGQVARFLNGWQADAAVSSPSEDVEDEAEEVEPVEDVAEPVAAKEPKAEQEPDFSKAPARDWRGDKTPAFVDWLWEHYPEHAAVRYTGRRTHRSDEG